MNGNEGAKVTTFYVNSDYFSGNKTREQAVMKERFTFAALFTVLLVMGWYLTSTYLGSGEEQLVGMILGVCVHATLLLVKISGRVWFGGVAGELWERVESVGDDLLSVRGTGLVWVVRYDKDAGKVASGRFTLAVAHLTTSVVMSVVAVVCVAAGLPYLLGGLWAGMGVGSLINAVVHLATHKHFTRRLVEGYDNLLAYYKGQEVLL